MEKNKNNDSGTLEKLALVAESVQTLFRGKGTIIFTDLFTDLIFLIT